MTPEKLQIRSWADNLPLSALYLAPQGPARGVVQIAHGMAEHKERYLPLMEFLSENGFASLVPDHRGHGESLQGKDDLGYLYNNAARSLVDDTHQWAGEGKARHPGRPFILFGHSMGSLIVRAYAQRYGAGLDGLIVCGCPTDNPAKGLGLCYMRFLKALRGERYRSRSVDKLLFGANNQNFPGAKSAFAWLNSDPAAVFDYDSDPLCGFPFTLNGYIALIELMREIYNGKPVAAEKPALPVLFISGRDDPCMGAPERLEAAAARLRKAGYENVDTRIYEGMRHEILNEPQRQIVYADILDFLNGIAPEAGA